MTISTKFSITQTGLPTATKELSFEGISSHGTDTWNDDMDLVHPHSPKCSENESSLALLELALNDKELDLFSDLIAIEEKEKEARQKHEDEFLNLKKEVKNLKETEARNKAKIDELLAENANLKKNICSLYKTSKSEIEHKDSMLAEANKKLDDLLFRKNQQNFPESRYEISDDRRRNDERKNSERSSSDTKVSKRRRVEDLTSKSHTSNQSGKGNLNQLKVKVFTPQRQSKSNNGNTWTKRQRVDTSDSVLQTIEPNLNTDSLSKDATETNKLFFNLLPEHLKQSFLEYEQNQIVSLNRLKQAFVSEYFNCDKISQPPSTIECTPKRSQGHFKKIVLNKNVQDTPSVHTSSFLTPSTSNRNERKSNNSVDVSRPRGKAFESLNIKVNTNKLTKNMQKDLASLFMYKKARIPFLDKRKFGLLKNGEKIVPKCVL